MCYGITNGHLSFAGYIDIRDSAGTHLERVPFSDAVEVTGLATQ
jgi:hypothetical protein